MAAGTIPRKLFSLVKRTSWVLTLAWKPAQRPKKPFSAPLDLMVSIIRIPDAVVDESFAASLICTRVMFTRFSEMIRDTNRLMIMAPTPMAVSTRLYRIMTTR